MKIKKILFLLAMGGVATGAFAQGGYQDGVDYYNADRYEQAKIILNKTLNDPSTKKGVAYYYLGAIDMRENKVAEAKAMFDKGIQADAAYGMNYVGLGEIALKNGDTKAAKEYFAEALKPDKKNPEVNAAVARAYFNVDPTAYSKEIGKYVADALKHSKNLSPDVYVLQGDMARAANKIGDAAAFYEQAITYEEQAGNVNPEAYVKYANLYNKVNNNFSIAKLEELTSKLPTSALAMRELAEKYYDSELYSKAAAQYGKYMSNPNHFQQDEQRYSQLLYFDGKNKESLDLAKGVLAKDPQNFYMYRMVLLNDAALGNNEEAVEYGAKLFAAPGAKFTSMDYRTYSDALAKLGRLEESAKVLEQGYQANPEKNVGMLADISAMYTNAESGKEENDINTENLAKAAEYQQKYIDIAEAPSLNDIFTLANRYRNLGLRLPVGSPERAEAANNGLKYIDLGLTKNPVNSVPFYRNRATLIQIRDGQEPSEELTNTYLELLKELDKDEANKTDNKNLYQAAYVSIAQYYLKNGDKATGRQYFQTLYDMYPDTPGVGDWLSKNK